MTIAHLLQDFGGSAVAGQPVTILSESDFEDQKLVSFEQGYTAGWEDSLQMKSDEYSRVTGALAQNLEDLSFTYREAYTQMLNSVTPVFSAMVDRILPEVMKDTVGHVIVEQLQDMIAAHDARSVIMSVPEGYGVTVQSMISDSSPLPVTINEDDTLIDGQIYLQVGGMEREVNTDGLLEDIRKAVHAFSFEVETEMANG